MSKKYEELLSFLKEKGLVNISEKEKQDLKVLADNRQDINMLKKELELLVSLNRSLISSFSTVCLKNMMKISDSIDDELIVKLFMLHEELKKKSIDEFACLKKFKGLAADILETNKKANLSIKQNVQTSFNEVMIGDSLYLTMIDKAEADKVFSNCLKRSSTFLGMYDQENLGRLVYFLKKNYDFTDKELVNISKKCATFFSSASAAKIASISKTINTFRDFIANRLQQAYNPQVVEALLDKDFKDMMINSSTIATYNPDSINETVKFLMGKSLGEIKSKFKGNKASIKGDFTPAQLAKIYNESITSLDTSVEKIADFCDNVSITFKKYFNRDLDLNKLINGHNFASLTQVNKDDYLVKNNKIESMFEILSMFINDNDMENLLKNNFSFLHAPISAVKESLKSAVLNSTNKDELRQYVLRKIRNHFDMYESVDYSKFFNGSNIKIEKFNKVSVKDMEENDIVNILNALNADSIEIDEWKKGWNKEEKEIRDLQIQIDLEDLINETDSLNDLIDFDFKDVEEFLDEINQAKGLYNEIQEKYTLVIKNKKLNKKLLELSNVLDEKLLKCSKKIDENIQVVIEVYKEQISKINEGIKEYKIKEREYERNIESIDRLENIINEKNLDLDDIETDEEMIVLGKRILDDYRNVTKKVKENTKSADKCAEVLYDLFEKEENSRCKKLVQEQGLMVDPEELNYAVNMFAHFVKVLYNEDLIYNVEEVGDFDEGDVRMYDQYKKLLNLEQRKITDYIYYLYTINNEMEKVIFDSMKDFLECYNVDDESIVTLKGAYSKLSSYISKMEKEVKEKKKFFSDIKRLDLKNVEIDIDGVKSKLDELNGSIEELVVKISELENSKTKK